MRRVALLLALLLLPPSSSRSEIRFSEVASDWGLLFRHHSGAAGHYHQPETDGSGLALFDYDGDGDVDVFFVDGGGFAGYEGEAARSRLFRNEGLAAGAPRFREVTGEAGLRVAPRYGMGATAGDVDGDGDLDLYVTGVGANQLFRNDGDGSFTDVTAAAGVGEERWSASAAFGDVDRDGDLDLYVTNYLVWSPEDAPKCSDGGLRAYCHPALLAGEPDRLYRNRGGGAFEDATAAAGLAGADGKGLGVVLADLDGDGWTDLYVANDTTANFFYRNRGDGTFEDLSLLSGTAFSDRTEPEAGMGVAIGDLYGNGLPEIYVTNYALETNALYRNQGGGLFTDARHLAGVAEPSIPVLGFGTAFADFDQDGDLDLVVANGHVLDNIEQIRPGIAYAQPNQLLEQYEPGRFRVAAAGLDVVRVSRGLAAGDLDGDGDLELVISNSNDLAEVYENVSPGGGWLQVDLQGSAGGNTFAVGSRVEVEAGGRRRATEVITASSYLSQSPLTLHVGLGAAPGPVRVVVRWPGGREQRLESLPPGRRLRLFSRTAAP